MLNETFVPSPFGEFGIIPIRYEIIKEKRLVVCIASGGENHAGEL
jgi:hypothetical protein